MDCTGKLVSVTHEWLTGKVRLLFEINEKPTEEINDLLKCEKLAVTAKKWRNKRSLDANGLLWKCLDDIAKAMNPPADKWDVYLTMLKRYGKFTYICVKPNVVDAMKAQWRECEVVGDIEINGTKAVQMLCYFGSSTYDTKEFSVLLDGVISEMQNMKLPIPPSKDMQRALEQWEQKHG